MCEDYVLLQLLVYDCASAREGVAWWEVGDECGFVICKRIVEFRLDSSVLSKYEMIWTWRGQIDVHPILAGGIKLNTSLTNRIRYDRKTSKGKDPWYEWEKENKGTNEVCAILFRE